MAKILIYKKYLIYSVSLSGIVKSYNPKDSVFFKISLVKTIKSNNSNDME